MIHSWVPLTPLRRSAGILTTASILSIMGYTTRLQIKFYDPAERLYVEEGLSPQAIREVLVDQHGEDDPPSRRTIYNWSQEGEWKAARRRWLQETEDIRLNMREAVRAATAEAIAHPTRDSLSALKNAVSAAKDWEQLQGIERAVDNATDERDPSDVASDALAIVKQALEGK